jgi:hypothetical protein
LATAGTFVQTHMAIRAVQTTSTRPGTATGASVNMGQIRNLLHWRSSLIGVPSSILMMGDCQRVATWMPSVTVYLPKGLATAYRGADVRSLRRRCGLPRSGCGGVHPPCRALRDWPLASWGPSVIPPPLRITAIYGAVCKRLQKTSQKILFIPRCESPFHNV